MKLSLKLTFFFCFLSGIFAFAQSNPVDTNTYVIKKSDGSKFIGKIISQDAREVLIITKDNRQFFIPQHEIKEIKLIDSEKLKSNEEYLGNFKFPNPHDTRYFFGPTGIPIKHKKGYYQNVLLTTNFINYGITKNISIGGGFEFISTILRKPIWFLTPKIGYDLSDNAHLAGGVLIAGFAAEGSATLGYGVFTLGNTETNLSLGIGYGFMQGELSKYPAVMISGTHRVSNGIALLSENYIIPNSGFFGIQGIRILSNRNSFDIGAIIIPEIANYIPALPFVGYSIAF